jgi:predicted nucleic acid-binding protein
MLVDTSGLLCLIHRRESQHESAISFYDSATTRVTHNYILVEFVSLAQARHVSRQTALDFSERLLNDTPTPRGLPARGPRIARLK